MPTLQTEEDIITYLSLYQFSTQFPPPPDNTEAHIIELAGEKFTREAFLASVNTLSKEAVYHLLNYPLNILIHNNVSGHFGYGSEQSIRYVLIDSNSPIVKEVLSETRT